MKQSDRIEYLLAMDIESSKMHSSTLSFFWGMFFLSFMIISLGILFIGFFNSYTIIRLLPLISKIMLWGIVVCVIVDGVNIISHINFKKDLDRRFLDRNGKERKNKGF